VGIPVHREGVNHVLATSWTNTGRLVVLAQQVRVGKTAWVVSPEGPGVSDDVHFGDLLLMDENESVTTQVPLREKGEWALQAFARPRGEGFVAITSTPGNTRCYLVTNDGSLSACSAPGGYNFAPFEMYFSPVPSELFSRQRFESGFRDEAIDLRTGTVRPLDDQFLSLWIRSYHMLEHEQSTLKPCSMSRSRLSPREDRWAVICISTKDLEVKASLWVLERNALPSMVHEYPARTKDETLKQMQAQSGAPQRDMLRYLDEHYGLAWSSDETYLYWCLPSEQTGSVVYLDGRPPIESAPCLTLASWSPDGSQLAGLSGGQVRKWSMSQGERPGT